MRNDEAYANAAFIPDADGFPPRWQAEAAAFRSALGDRAQIGLRYGSGRRHLYDLFAPETAPTGTLIFVHGGYWRRFDRSDWSAFAAGALARGWAVAMPSYTLAPEATIPQITQEIAAALAAIAGRTQGPLALAGHSAGGHLVARMLCADVALPQQVAARLARCVPISPVADLRPLIDTEMNADLRLDAATARAESPALQRLARAVPVTVWVGGDERPAFVDQARLLAEAWGAARHVAPGRHHFDVIDGLAAPDTPLMRAVLGGPG